MKNPVRLMCLTLVGALAWSACAAVIAEEVNLYSARKEALIKPLLDKFTEETGIDVNLVTGKAGALLQRLVIEGANSPADLLITVDAGRLHRAKTSNVLQPVDSKALKAAVPSHLRDKDDHWYGLSMRARPIFYLKENVDPAGLSTYEDLADPKWKGRICVRSSNNIYNQSLVASMIASIGEDATSKWAEGFVANFARPPKGGDRDQIKAAAAGLCDLAIANTYYYGKMMGGKDEEQKAAAEKLTAFWPNQDDRGTHVNVSGIGVTAAAKNKENAIRLMEYLVSPESQQWYSEVNYEYPVLEGVAWSDVLENMGRFKADSLNLSMLGENNPAAVKLMDRVGWR
jgi:iron(III) transport system substrate-binding protein